MPRQVTKPLVVTAGGDDGAGTAIDDRCGVLQTADRSHTAGDFDEPAGGVALGAHGSGGEVLEPDRCGGCPEDRLRLWGTEVTDHVGYVGEDEQHVGIECLGEYRGREVLVHDGFDTFDSSLLVSDDRYTAATGADNDGAAGQQQPDEPRLHNSLGLGCCLLYTSDAADDLLCVDLGG